MIKTKKHIANIVSKPVCIRYQSVCMSVCIFVSQPVCLFACEYEPIDNLTSLSLTKRVWLRPLSQGAPLLYLLTPGLCLLSVTSTSEPCVSGLVEQRPRKQAILKRREEGNQKGLASGFGGKGSNIAMINNMLPVDKDSVALPGIAAVTIEADFALVGGGVRILRPSTVLRGSLCVNKRLVLTFVGAG